MTKKDQIDEILTRGVENVYPKSDALEKVLNSSKKLKIFTGIDPTGELHIGHGVVLNKLRQFQELGHEITVLIGGFTGQIGDPTDKGSVRKKLTTAQIKKNSKNYKKLIGGILDSKKTKFVNNSKWLSKMKFSDIIDLSSEFTVQQLMERDMFQQRVKDEKPIYLHEFLYPIMQGYDSVAMNIDMEVGGNDQTFNMLAGRTLMRSMKDKEKFVLTTKLLADPSGKKMGKTEGNVISLTDSPEDMYGKVMSWPDNMIILGFEILTRVPMKEVKHIVDELSKDGNPKGVKKRLAFQVVTMYHDKKAAEKAEKHFKQVFEDKFNPDDIETVKIKSKNIIEVLVESGLAESKAEAKRVLAQGGVKVDAKKVSDEKFEIPAIDQDGVVIQKGKRHFVKIVK